MPATHRKSPSRTPAPAARRERRAAAAETGVPDAVHATEVGHAERQPVDGTGDALLPHDRDEAVGITDGAQDPAMQQAHRDLQHGLRDTDRGVVTDSVYRRLKAGGAAGGTTQGGDHHGRGQRER